MGRSNVKNKKTGMWRCWSTVVDNWVCDWMTEKDYKEWLIEEAAQQMADDLEYFGIREDRFRSVAECEYIRKMDEFCEKCDRTSTDCDECEKNISFNKYVANGDNYLGIDLEE